MIGNRGNTGATTSGNYRAGRESSQLRVASGSTAIVNGLGVVGGASRGDAYWQGARVAKILRLAISCAQIQISTNIAFIQKTCVFVHGHIYLHFFYIKKSSFILNYVVI